MFFSLVLGGWLGKANMSLKTGDARERMSL